MKRKAVAWGGTFEELKGWESLRWRVIEGVKEQGFYIDWRDDSPGLLIHFYFGHGQLCIGGPAEK